MARESSVMRRCGGERESKEQRPTYAHKKPYFEVDSLASADEGDQFERRAHLLHDGARLLEPSTFIETPCTHVCLLDDQHHMFDASSQSVFANETDHLCTDASTTPLGEHVQVEQEREGLRATESVHRIVGDVDGAKHCHLHVPTRNVVDTASKDAVLEQLARPFCAAPLSQTIPPPQNTRRHDGPAKVASIDCLLHDLVLSVHPISQTLSILSSANVTDGTCPEVEAIGHRGRRWKLSYGYHRTL